MSIASTTAVSGLINSQQRVAKSAENIAKAGAGLGGDATEELVNVQAAKNDFAANATVLKVDKELTQTLLDVIA